MAGSVGMNKGMSLIFMNRAGCGGHGSARGIE